MNPLVVLGGIAAFGLPVFRSGLKGDMTFAEMIYNHTVFAEFPIYVPQELILPPERLKEIEAVSRIEPVEIEPVDSTYYMARQRFGYEEHDLREWITPSSPKVKAYADCLYVPDRDSYIATCWSWVCKAFNYARYDYHMMEAFMGPWTAGSVYRQPDFWHFPAEMIGFYEEYADQVAQGRRSPDNKPVGDCEDLTNLLASLLLCYTNGVWANLGFHEGRGHAWVTVERYGEEYILETTYTADKITRLVQSSPWIKEASSPEYEAIYRFDNVTLKRLSA